MNASLLPQSRPYQHRCRRYARPFHPCIRLLLRSLKCCISLNCTEIQDENRLLLYAAKCSVQECPAHGQGIGCGAQLQAHQPSQWGAHDT
ncbi:unnamed protein product [Darwinula stevensoni]|uniref:Uncharacterized protein n=1 Tax=Darwinula stevensoni TaxID=69355 RepID=A0A7R9AEV7_9CRUS|nr:unnamed protein product [Darwinula stevensoni]CAG0902470.1 unnamed protein product [Darwinula stevensoni]